MDVNDIIQILKLKKHPEEGGYFVETFRSELTISINGESQQTEQNRSLHTAIYYFLTPETFSKIHRLRSDEIFHFYLGDPVEMVQLYPGGEGKLIRIGHDIVNGFCPQVLVPKNVWQGSRLLKGGRYALMGTTMSPGFDYVDYESGNRGDLIQQYPAFKELITCLTPT